jgi:hypothetical protein
MVRDLVVDGKTIAKAGAPAKGKVTYAKSSGRLHAPGQVTVRLTSIQLGDGKSLPVSTSGFRAKGKSHTKSNVTHPAAAEFLDDAIVRDGLADHWRESYVRKTGKSMNTLELAAFQKDNCCNIPIAPIPPPPSFSTMW